MKKNLVIVLAVSALLLSGCGKNGSGRFDPNNPNAKEHVQYAKEVAGEMSSQIESAQTSAQQQAEDRKAEFTKNLKKISCDSIELPELGKLKPKSYGISNVYDQQVITIVADFTNNYESDISLYNLLGYCTCYQDSVALNSIITEFDYDNGTNIKPGKTLEVAFSYILRNESSDIELTAYQDYLVNESVESTTSFPIK